MPTYKWKIDCRDMERRYINGSKVWAKYFRDQVIERRKYYEGFNVGKEKTMFQEELQDLEVVYKTALKNYAKEVEETLPSLLYYMEKFLTVHKQNEVVREKLDALLQKTGREPQEESDGGDDE